MGSLTSRPKIPQVQQQPVIITVPSAPVVTSSPAPAQTAASTTIQSSAAETATTNETTSTAKGTSNEEAQRLSREDNLLRRSRGRLSTVLTGFTGLLSQGENAGRKTLLGE